MMARIGIVGRLVLILLAALVLVQLVTTALYFWRREQAFDARMAVPLADQVAATAALVEATPAAQLPLVLRAVNGPDLLVTVADEPGEIRDPALPRRPLETVIRSGLPALDPPRLVSIQYRGLREPGGRPRLLGRLLASRIEVTVGLAGGRYLKVVADGEVMPRLFGLQPGFFAGIIGLTVALLAIVLFSRESRPLRRLARAVQAFGRDPEPRPVAEAGAAEVRVLIRAFNDMQARLAGLMRNRAFVLGALAHDLRTYLTRLRLRAEMLPEDGDRTGWIRNLEHMNQLVEDSLTFARVAFGADRAGRSDLARIVAREVEERQAQGAPVTLAAAAPGPLTVAGSEAALARALANLIDNALKHAGSAEIALGRDGGNARLTVDDRGPGIPAALRADLAQPFRQADAARTKADAGAGLGLAIAREIAEGLGGRLEIGDRPGGGARIALVLPLA
ncbi:ATP-binding protein [Zavarzinia compransoris]|uniref:histidine kinase n=1 Tax=Zavarzinia compransoris TaxID=1264899 RepID=A0A317DVV4_9PROT|nr:ATP-binding protein [Zavarzinia compransoris]PWR18837.1 ATP-binding protein [Zavarzinia compransoris]TDP48827.1 signal transduction histidine kinase [Zavarzinia compransoris]